MAQERFKLYPTWLLLVFAESNRICAQAETKKLYTLLNQVIVNLSVTKSPDLFHK